MKKVTRHFVLTALSVLLALSLCFTAFGCGGNNVTDDPGDDTLDTGIKYEGNEIAGFELPHSAGQATDDFYDYDSDLYYLNETRISGADPERFTLPPKTSPIRTKNSPGHGSISTITANGSGRTEKARKRSSNSTARSNTGWKRTVTGII